ncbi:hypothetical protein [Reyranella sp.]|uniref:hypothetical protein n=1 Tax=Reyranella sp. TaxID=1929291 RepID=UPI002723AB69|nr:hypothetical protein [Reyranella sp.]MDO8973887.1 hypothetical protein [Reyranella sp.]
MTRKISSVKVDDVFVNVAQPQREWRVIQYDGETFTLERVDRPRSLRFVQINELLDSTRYLSSRPVGA